MEVTNEVLAKLAEPMIPRWRVQSLTKDKKKAIIVPYLDSRMVQQRLDEVVGSANWCNNYDPENGASSIGIRINGEFISKSDVGVESKESKDKGKASDGFKRAAVLWGIGRNIYSIGSKILNTNENGSPVTSTGKVLYTGDQLSAYMNNLNTSVGLLSQIWNENADKQNIPEFQELITKLKKMLV